MSQAVARNSKLTPETVKAIVYAVRMGYTRRMAAHVALITHQTLYNWERQGEADIEAEVDSAHADFVRKLRDAERDLCSKLLHNILTAAREPRYWKAAAWMLERLWREDYGYSSARRDDDAAAPTEQITVYLPHKEEE